MTHGLHGHTRGSWTTNDGAYEKARTHAQSNPEANANTVTRQDTPPTSEIVDCSFKPSCYKWPEQATH
jgi:hypothetical protein